MMLTEVAPVPDALLPQEAFKAHLRLGTGFGTDTLQEEVLLGFLRAAVAAVEARTGKALLQRAFVLTVPHWDDPRGQRMPIAPVSQITGLTLEDGDGAQTQALSSGYRLELDQHFPVVRPTGTCLPTIPPSGQARILFEAGLAPEWGALPADIAQAVLMLAAHYYEYRDQTQFHGGCMPFGVTSLIERYRALRLSAGGAR